MRHDEVIRVLQDPLAQELLHAAIPARLAYTGRDGSPRAVPIGFFWNGAQLVLATTPKTPKVAALRAHPKVALTIDTTTMPPHVLLIRGTATIEVVDGVPSEYLDGARKFVPPAEWSSFEAQVRAMYKQMARITIEPEWAKLLDFETRLPSAIEELIREQAGKPAR